MEATDNLQNRGSANKTGPIPKSGKKALVESGTACGCCSVNAESDPTQPVDEIGGAPEAGNNVEHSIPKSGIINPAESFTFKTNINCSGCLAKVAPALDAEKAIQKWEVDLHSPDRTLSVTSRGISVQQLMNAVRDAGYYIEPITSNK